MQLYLNGYTPGDPLIQDADPAGYLVRFHIELDREARKNRKVTPEQLVELANRIMHPYYVEVKEVGWWSVYEIGQRRCDKFDDVPAEGRPPGYRGCSSRAMPATPTAPKAGQGNEEFQRYFIAHGRFAAGVATRYAASPITGEATFQHLAQGFARTSAPANCARGSSHTARLPAAAFGYRFHYAGNSDSS